MSQESQTQPQPSPPGQPACPPLSVGSMLPTVTRRVSTVQIFRYSAATWNTHRIHYDQGYAAAEGYPGVLVQSHLHGAFLVQYCTDWMGPRGRLLALSLSVRRYAVAGQQLTVAGEVTGLEQQPGGGIVVSLRLTETRSPDGETCAAGSARILFPPA